MQLLINSVRGQKSIGRVAVRYASGGSLGMVTPDS